MLPRPNATPTLLCAADGEGQGQLSPVPGVKGKGSIFLTHATTWPGGGSQSCPRALQASHLYSSTGQLHRVVQARCRTCGGSASSPTLMTSGPALPLATGSVWQRRSGARSLGTFPAWGHLSSLSARCRATLQLGSARISSPSVPGASISHLQEVVRGMGCLSLTLTPV